MKEWISVYKHKGYEIKVLNNAEVGDEFGYKVEPTISEGTTYLTVGVAIEAIEKITI